MNMHKKLDLYCVGARLEYRGRAEKPYELDYVRGTIAKVDPRNVEFRYLVYFDSGAKKWMTRAEVMAQYQVI